MWGTESRQKTMNRFLLLLLTFAVAATASRAETAVVVHQKSGGTVEYAFSEEPVVSYADGCLVISSVDALVYYPLNNVQKFTFAELSDHWTRIVAPAEQKPLPTYIYNLGGVLLRTLEPNGDGSTSASLDGLPAGTYIIKNGKTSYKTIIR